MNWYTTNFNILSRTLIYSPVLYISLIRPWGCERGPDPVMAQTIPGVQISKSLSICLGGITFERTPQLGLYTYLGVSSGSQFVANQVHVLKERKISTSFTSSAGTLSLGLTEGSRSRSWGEVIISTFLSNSSLWARLKLCFVSYG